MARQLRGMVALDGEGVKRAARERGLGAATGGEILVDFRAEKC